MIRIRVFRPADGTVRTAERSELAGLLASEEAVLWIDVEAPEPGEESILADPFHFHPVVIDTCTAPSSSARIQEIGEVLLLTLHEARLPESLHEDPFDTAELDAVLGKRFLITYHDKPLDCITQIRDALVRSPKVMSRGPVWLLHELLDRLVDAYLPVMDRIDEEIEALEDRVVGTPSRRDLETVLTLRRSLQRIRRASARHKEILLFLSRGDVELISDELRPWFRNVHDHLARVADLSESYRDLLGGVLDAYLSTTSNRLNEVMKVLTVIATVMMPMTCIAGVYGMNFDRGQPANMPELGWPYGYFFALGLMAFVGLGLLAYFRFRKWL